MFKFNLSMKYVTFAINISIEVTTICLYDSSSVSPSEHYNYMFRKYFRINLAAAKFETINRKAPFKPKELLT